MAHYGRLDPDAPLYVADFAAAARLVRTDAPERALLRLVPFAPIRVRQRDDFLAQHSSFFIFAELGENGFWDWLPEALAAEGHSVRLLAVDRSSGAGHAFYRVDSR